MKSFLLTLALAGNASQGLSLAELGVHGEDQGTTATKGCGAFCVAIAARRSGLDEVTFSEATTLTDPDDDGLCSVTDIVSALGELGVSAEARHSARRTIPSGLSILHVRSSPKVAEADHFVVAEGSDPGRHRFYIPPIGAGVDDDDRIAKLWDGNYVLISTPEGVGGAHYILAASTGFAALAGAYLLKRCRKFEEVQV